MARFIKCRDFLLEDTEFHVNLDHVLVVVDREVELNDGPANPATGQPTVSGRTRVLELHVARGDLGSRIYSDEPRCVRVADPGQIASILAILEAP